MQKHFKLIGVFDPTKTEEIHVDSVDLKDIYEEYKADMFAFCKFNSKQFLSYSRFCWLIEVAFSFVKISDYRSVSLTTLPSNA